MRTLSSVGLVGLSCFVHEGCAPLPLPRASVVSTSVDAEAMLSPTGSIRITFSGAVKAAEMAETIVLVRGEPNSPLVHELERPPVSLRERKNLVAVELAQSQGGTTVTLTPRRSLLSGARYTLVVGAALHVDASRLGRSTIRTFLTGSVDDAAPVLELVDPMDGQLDVSTQLGTVHVRYSKPVVHPDALWLVDDEGLSGPRTVEQDGCTTCYRLELGRQLADEVFYSVRAAPDVVDGEGRPLFGDPPRFRCADRAVSFDGGG